MSRNQLIYGIHTVLGALRANLGNVLEVWMDQRRQDARMRAIENAAQQMGLKVQAVQGKTLQRLVGEAGHQGVVARYRLGRDLAENDLLKILDDIDVPAFVLVLDGVTDPHNLGACLRTAEAAGVHAVIAPADRAAPITPVVRKIACGAAERLPFVTVSNLARTLRALQSQGLWICGTDERAGTCLYELDLTMPLALVLGAEGKGMRRLTREHCDYLSYLPMAGRVESLNVSVAAGICLYEALRQRSGARVFLT